jgi:hypothetical protein
MGKARICHAYQYYPTGGRRTNDPSSERGRVVIPGNASHYGDAGMIPRDNDLRVLCMQRQVEPNPLVNTRSSIREP